MSCCTCHEQILINHIGYSIAALLPVEVSVQFPLARSCSGADELLRHNYSQPVHIHFTRAASFVKVLLSWFSFTEPVSQLLFEQSFFPKFYFVACCFHFMSILTLF